LHRGNAAPAALVGALQVGQHNAAQRCVGEMQTASNAPDTCDGRGNAAPAAFLDALQVIKQHHRSAVQCQYDCTCIALMQHLQLFLVLFK
jgi:hypothetical protein